MSKLLQTTIRVRTLFLVCVILAIVFGAGVLITQNFWFEQLRAWARGSVDVAAEKYVNNLPQTDRVEIYLLANGALKRSTNGVKPFRVWDISCPVISEMLLTGGEATKFCSMWRSLRCYWGWASLCHEPVYGFRFYDGAKLLFETSFCWKCSDFVVPTPLGHAFCGFDRESTNAQAFWTLLQHHIPLPTSLTNGLPTKL